MTEHDKSSAVVEETRETVETPQPETTEKTAEKKNGSNKTSLALSAIAIAIALAAGSACMAGEATALTRRPPAMRW
jgi:uroporphyrin-3 C-methyltransferase